MMTAKLTLDYSGAQKFFRSEELTYLEPKVEMAHKMLHERTGPGHDFLGWLEWPFRYDQVEFGEIKKAAARIHDQAEVLVVVGIGGSYLGARAAIELLSPAFVNSAQGKAPQILYAGNHLSADYLSGLLDYLREKDFAVNVISKSGTTEPAVAFGFSKNCWREVRKGGGADLLPIGKGAPFEKRRRKDIYQ